MAKYRKKPVVIEAVRWNGRNFNEIVRLNKLGTRKIRVLDPGMGNSSLRLGIPTLEGEMIAQFNDWIIQGIKGELYPCKPDIFERTYELVGERKPEEPDCDLDPYTCEKLDNNFCLHRNIFCTQI